MDEDEDDEDGRWDAVDGGTTATVAVVLRGTTLVLGCVGDSSAALLARDDDSGAAAHELLMEEHGPTHLAEYARLREVEAAEDMQWVYDCPGGEQVPIFRDGADGKGEPELDPDAVRRADTLECAVKNARGDLFSVVVVPERSVALPPPPRAVRRGTTHEHTEAAVCSLDEQNITMVSRAKALPPARRPAGRVLSACNCHGSDAVHWRLLRAPPRRELRAGDPRDRPGDDRASGVDAPPPPPRERWRVGPVGLRRAGGPAGTAEAIRTTETLPLLPRSAHTPQLL